MVRVPCLTVFIVASLLFSSSVFSLEPPSEPILRLETGAHAGRIYRLAADGEGKYVVSASMDKTVRIWEGKSGKLLSVLRPPIGDDMEGELYALALSPDGKTIACAGYTGKDWGERSIYLFDIATGRLQRRLTEGLTEYVLFLAYSRDGKYLAALQPYSARSHALSERVTENSSGAITVITEAAPHALCSAGSAEPEASTLRRTIKTE